MQPAGSGTASRGLRLSVPSTGTNGNAWNVSESGKCRLFFRQKRKKMEDKHVQSIGANDEDGGEDEKRTWEMHG